MTTAAPGRPRLDPFQGFVPHLTQQEFLSWRPPRPDLPDVRLLSSGYASGGKSTVGCRESLRYAMAFENSRHGVSRFHYDDLRDTTMVTYMEAMDRIGLNDGTKPGMRHYTFRWSPRPEIDWWHGGKTMFRNLDDPTGSKYGSMEVNTWFIDEGFEVPEDVIQVIFPSRLRWHLPNCRFKEEVTRWIAERKDPSQIPCQCPKRMWVCTNPGPNQELIDIVEGRVGNSRHFPVPPGENIHAGPGYYEALAERAKARGPVYYARFYEGSWDAFEGQRFTMMDRQHHFLDKDFMPAQSVFDIIECHDPGFRNPHGIVWLAVHKQRELPPIVVDDWERAEWEIPDIAAFVKARRELYRWNPREILCVGDPAGEQRRGQSGLSDYQIFAQHGIEIIPMHRSKEPEPRADLLALMLSRTVKTRDGQMRGLMFCPRAKLTFERMLKYRYVEKSRTSPADAPEKFLKKDDHLVDAIGHGVSAIADPLEQDSWQQDDWNEAVRHLKIPSIEELDATAFVKPDYL